MEVAWFFDGGQDRSGEQSEGKQSEAREYGVVRVAGAAVVCRAGRGIWTRHLELCE